MGEGLFSFLVEVGYRDTGSEDSVIRVLGGQVCGGFCCEVLGRGVS